MAELIGTVVLFFLLGGLLCLSLWVTHKERQEIRQFRQSVLNSIFQISLTIEEVFKERY